MFSLILKLLFSLTVASVTGKYVQDDELPELKWPKTYTFEATKTSLTSGLIEDVNYWRSSKKSRVDYNSGAVKSVAVKGKRKSSFPYGVKYEVHPQTTSKYLNKLFCTRSNGTLFNQITLEEVLPTASDFTHVGKDILEYGPVEKFYYQEDEESNKETRKYLWASLDQNNGSWIPVRIEEIDYIPWLGKLYQRFVWDIFNYKTEFDDTVFDIDQYNCTDPKEDDENKDLASVDPENEEHVEFAFNKFQKQHNKRYNTENERELRKNIFQKNLRLIQAHSHKSSSYKLTLNKFADQTPREMERRMGLRRRKEGVTGTHAFPYSNKQIFKLSQDLPSEFDLRLDGLISPVKDQEDCGSCWTFGTTSAVEGAIARSNGGRLLRLANQALIDCAWGSQDSGCDGGSDTDAYHWLIDNGLPTEEEYGSYSNKDGFCHMANMTKIYHIKGFTDVTPFSIDALKVALINHGPLSVSIDATSSLTLYSSGIFYDMECEPTKLNHEVSLVGYGDLDGEPYWIVKNSWGQNWGIDGYFHISMRDQSCGITTEPTYAVV